MSARSRTAVWVVAGVLIVGVGAAATPAVATIIEGVGTATRSLSRVSLTPRPVAAATAVPTEAGLPSGYVDLGPVSIPAGGLDGCKAMSYINIESVNGGPFTATLLGPALVDMGARQYARGTITRDAQGQIVSYTVAPGDVLGAIGDRFCIYDGSSLSTLNGLQPWTVIQPGEVLKLQPGPGGS